MATDGVKIIDGDLAYDVYNTFMELYDAGQPLEIIRATVEQLRVDNDDVDEEIFITAYALALWEVGQLDAEILSQVELAIKQGAFANYLTQSENILSEGRKRQQVLNRFWIKISQPTSRVRKRKIHKLQTKFVFNEYEVITFQMQDGTYRAAILLVISQYSGHCDYQFAMPTYISPIKPTLADIKSGEILGRIYAPEGKFGFNIVDIGHKHLRAIADKFELIGHLEINQLARGFGSQLGAIDFKGFASCFKDFNSFLDVKMTAKTHPKKVFPIQKLL